MIMKAFTFHSLAASLEDTPPGFGVTVNYEILEGLVENLIDSKLPAGLKSELEALAEEHDCAFEDWGEHRFVQFTKKRRHP